MNFKETIISCVVSIFKCPLLCKVVDFCRDDQELGHVYGAPNKHNAMCGSASTWTIISNHPDFAFNKYVDLIDSSPQC